MCFRNTVPVSALLAALAWMSGCGDGATEPTPDPPRPATVTVTPANAELAALGATAQLTAQVMDQYGQVMASANVTWSSSAALVAAVDGSGLVTAAGNGAATITATAGSASGTAAVTVRQQVSAVAVTPAADTMVERDTLRIAAEATDANGHVVAGAEFTWSSGDEAVARVDADGLVTGVGAGEVEVTASSSGVAGRAELLVEAPVATAVTVAPDTLEFTALADTVRLMAEVRDQIGRVMEGEPVAWASGDTMAATVDPAGLVTAVGNGAATITATSGEVAGEALVTVMQLAGVVVISPPVGTIAPGDTVRFAAEAYDQNGHRVEGAVFVWSSSEVAVATVDGSGVVRGIAEGTSIITATADGVQGTAEITVTNPDRAALVALYRATDGPNWGNNEGWLSDAPLNEWYGVVVDGFGRVARLNLHGRWDEEQREWIPHGLQGPIPAELANLTNLQYLRLDHNALTGGIPVELGNLVSLRGLHLGSNNLTGSIPAELGGLSSLKNLSLGGNELSGSIPAALGSLAALRSLWLAGNELTGSIPSELGNLANLEWLGIDNNSLTGPIPAELGSLGVLRSLWLAGNQLTGSIPGELGRLSNLESLDVGRNSLTGRIPAELGSLAALRYLSLGSNELSGSIPPEIGSLVNLESLAVDWNELSGTMPRSLLQLVNLRGLYFNLNDGLCAPGITGFASWLEGIERTDGPFCNEPDKEALELLFETAGGSGWTSSDRWLETQALEEWHGVTADTLGRVSVLDLGGNGLAGKVPSWRSGALVQLAELRIGDNARLAGRLPLSLTGLSLRVLHYADTDLCAPADEAFARWLNSIASHEGTGSVCAPLSDREILEIVYQATGGPDWTNSTNWLTHRQLADWHGVTVDGRGRVVALDLFANRLSGTLPAELGKLSELRRMVIARNYGGLAGPIPPQLGNLANLEELSLFSNALEGSIPPELGKLRNLSGLFLHDNELEGAIPADLGDLVNLRHLFLAGNRLTGPVPVALSKLSRLRELSLVRNGLTGPLPAELGRLGALQTLYAGHNALSGRMPPEFGNLTSLRTLALSGNTEMSGALPHSLIGLRSLELLEASGTQLCAPSDPRFLEWLDRLPNPRVARCGGEPAQAYLVQPVQSREFPVPLVAGEEALLRVFVTAAEDNEERLPTVRASFHLDGALAHVAEIEGKSGPIPTEVDEGSLAKSVNAVLPGEVVRPGLEMVIEIDPDGTLDPGLGVTTRIPETGRMRVDVHEVPFLDLTVIPFLWSTEPDSAILEHTAGMASDPEGHELLELARILMPIAELDVRAHEAVMSSSNDAYAIYRETWAIRTMEGGTGYYMGMMSGPVTGAGGLGALGRPVNFSVPGSGVIAHELGHNMSLSHAPCGGAAGPDQAFPHLGGATGAWGFDFRAGGRIMGPEHKDLMGYCSPDWISDFHFTKALNFRLDGEADAMGAMASGPETSLLLWGGEDSTGTPLLEPAFVVDAPPSLPESGGDYLITARDGRGGQLFSLSFAMPEQADGNRSPSFAFALPVRPEWAGELAFITLAGPAGSVTLDAETSQPMAILRNPRTGQVRGFLRGLPPTAPAAMDVAGQTAGPGLEVYFSRGIPGVDGWRR